MDAMLELTEADFDCVLLAHLEDRKQRFADKTEQPHACLPDLVQAFKHDLTAFYSECQSSALLRVANLVRDVANCDAAEFPLNYAFDLCQVSGRLCTEQILIPSCVHFTAAHTLDLFSAARVPVAAPASSHPGPQPARKRRRANSPVAFDAGCRGVLRVHSSYEPFCASLWLVTHMDGVENMRAEVARQGKSAELNELALPPKHLRVYFHAFRCVADVVTRTRRALYASASPSDV